ncbi:MAG TPA: DUF4760 domain-containing protein [Verrucomicrobiae bacterium]|jgi:hypothetical protein|nr:DUF4760 domain-containing protein [Verrucomicrobiae bacterium]
MSPEWLTAIGTLGTFIVIAASAVAALMQLRHMRAGNQIVALNEVRETIESSAFQETLLFLRELPQRLTDPEIRRSLADRTFPAEYQRLRTLANFFEHLGTLVKKHIIDADIAADLWGGVILVNWYALAPIIANRRLAMDQPAVWENFEYLAVLCQKFRERHPKGTFPRGIERMPAPEIWPEVSGKDAR